MKRRTHSCTIKTVENPYVKIRSKLSVGRLYTVVPQILTLDKQ